MAGLKGIATALTAHGDVAAVLVSSGDPMAIVIGRSQNVGMDASKMLKTMLERFGGRGGGRPELAQGAGLVGQVNEFLAVARELLASALNRGRA